MQRAFSLGRLLMAAILLVPLSAGAIDPRNDVDAIGTRNVARKSIVSIEKEIAIGRQYALEIDKSAKLLTDPIVAEYVNRLGQNIARNSDLKIPLAVKVIDTPDINAFALPGGFLYLYRGLLTASEEEGELAGVMAHEVAHVAARHWASQMTRSTILQYAMIPVIFTPMSYPVYVGISQAMNLGIPLAFLKFSRSAEVEADLFGMQYLYKAGYDPNAYVAFFGRMIDVERRSPEGGAAVFSDHPMTGDRIIRAEEAIKQVLPQKPSYLVSTSEFDDVKERLQSMMRARRADKLASGKPTLQKRDDGKSSTTQPGAQTKEPDKPPVLRRSQ